MYLSQLTFICVLFYYKDLRLNFPLKTTSLSWTSPWRIETGLRLAPRSLETTWTQRLKEVLGPGLVWRLFPPQSHRSRDVVPLLPLVHLPAAGHGDRLLGRHRCVSSQTLLLITADYWAVQRTTTPYHLGRGLVQDLVLWLQWLFSTRFTGIFQAGSVPSFLFEGTMLFSI